MGASRSIIVLEAEQPDGTRRRSVSKVEANAWTEQLEPGDQVTIDADMHRAEVVQVLHVIDGTREPERAHREG